MQDLVGRVAVVTGAGSGIGRALAIRLATERMKVVAADVDAAALEATVAAVEEATGGAEVVAHAADVRLAGDVQAVADGAFAEMGQVDLLCNNAGVLVGGLMCERPAEDFAYCLDVNLHGIRAFLPRMIAQGTEGHVVTRCRWPGCSARRMSVPAGSRSSLRWRRPRRWRESWWQRDR